MKIVIDSNIFFAAIIKDSLIRQLLLLLDEEFLLPEFVFQEIENNQPMEIKAIFRSLKTAF